MWEWSNVNTIISQAADKGFGKYKTFTVEKQLKTWTEEIKLIIQQKIWNARRIFEQRP